MPAAQKGRPQGLVGDRLGLPYVDLTEFPVDRSVAGLIPQDAARRYAAVPVIRRRTAGSWWRWPTPPTCSRASGETSLAEVARATG